MVGVSSPSDGRPATIDRQDLTGHVAAGGPGQKDERAIEFVGLARTPERSFLDDPISQLRVGEHPEAGYSASKGGLISLTRELASQWSRRDIRVNALAPGWFPSEMSAGMFADPKLADWIVEKTPLRRPGQPHELDGALVFLAGDASSYMTGQVLAVDGGWTAI